MAESERHVTLDHDAWWAVLRAVNVYERAVGEMSTIPGAMRSDNSTAYNERRRLARVRHALHHPAKSPPGAEKGQERPESEAQQARSECVAFECPAPLGCVQQGRCRIAAGEWKTGEGPVRPENAMVRHTSEAQATDPEVDKLSAEVYWLAEMMDEASGLIMAVDTRQHPDGTVTTYVPDYWYDRTNDLLTRIRAYREGRSEGLENAMVRVRPNSGETWPDHDGKWLATPCTDGGGPVEGDQCLRIIHQHEDGTFVGVHVHFEGGPALSDVMDKVRLALEDKVAKIDRGQS